MYKILIVEDNDFFAKLMSHTIYKRFSFKVDIASSAKEARQKLSEHSYDLLVVDLILPDSEGEFIEEVCTDHKVVVTTSFEDDLTRKKITALDIVDYVIKSDSADFSYLLNVIHRLRMNERMSVLVVEDSLSIRNHIVSLLELQGLGVITANDGQEALDIIKEKPGEIDLVLTDYNMPNMDGLEFLKHLRKEYAIDELPAIILSAVGNESIIARFLKAGANDYILKPFSREEFFCRINLSLNNLEMLREAKESASTDHLTGLYNRYYMESRLEEITREKNETNALAIIDIDHFKEINDNYGHHTGDLALKFFAVQLLNHFDINNIIRIGGEEFLIVFPNMNTKKAVLKLEMLRQDVQEASFSDVNGRTMSLRFSAGVAETLKGGCEAVIRMADSYLYQAKENGRNRIEFEGSQT